LVTNQCLAGRTKVQPKENESFTHSCSCYVDVLSALVDYGTYLAEKEALEEKYLSAGFFETCSKKSASNP
jgi:hypothetical protein